MIMQDLLKATQVRSEFCQFVNNVVHIKPQAVKRIEIFLVYLSEHDF